ncbi:MAG TPA: hypothetical protein PKD53_05790 [Chloroflexaceae bacterium]|nr:hypothetical protein [Chloroflexaceae bacterium]
MRAAPPALLIESPTERTTAATDAVMAALALGYARSLLGGRGWRARVWAGAFGGLGLAAALGAAAHGLRLGERAHAALWRAIYLTLGLTVALFAAAATADGWGERAGRKALPITLLAALGFYGASQRLARGFIVFVVYEAAALLYALGVYARLARGGRLAGAELTAAGILISLLAAAVQSSSLRLTLLGLPFDNNGLFHLVQIAGLPVLAAGVRAALDHQPEH